MHAISYAITQTIVVFSNRFSKPSFVNIMITDTKTAHDLDSESHLQYEHVLTPKCTRKHKRHFLPTFSPSGDHVLDIDIECRDKVWLEATLSPPPADRFRRDGNLPSSNSAVEKVGMVTFHDNTACLWRWEWPSGFKRLLHEFNLQQ